MQHFDHNTTASNLILISDKHFGDDYIVSLREELASLRKRIVQSKGHAAQPADETLAQAWTLYAARSFWGHRRQSHCQLSSLREPWIDIPETGINPEIKNMLQTFGWRVALCPLPEAAYQIGLLYSTLVPHSLRRKKALYYTPPALASKLLRMATNAGADLASARILEPSCGSGVVLSYTRFLTSIQMRKVQRKMCQDRTVSSAARSA